MSGARWPAPVEKENGTDATNCLYPTARLFQATVRNRLALRRRARTRLAVRAEPFRRLHGLLRESDPGPCRADICMARLELEACPLADCIAGDPGFVHYQPVWRFARHGEQEIPA